MSDYQDRLTQARRAALWREVDRHHAARAHRKFERQWQADKRKLQFWDGERWITVACGKRNDQIAFSATVVFAILALALLAGVGCGVWAAIVRFGGGL